MGRTDNYWNIWHIILFMPHSHRRYCWHHWYVFPRFSLKSILKWWKSIPCKCVPLIERSFTPPVKPKIITSKWDGRLLIKAQQDEIIATYIFHCMQRRNKKLSRTVLFNKLLAYLWRSKCYSCCSHLKSYAKVLISCNEIERDDHSIA